MSTIPVQRLHASARGALLAHFLALSSEDRRLRFGSSLSAEGIAAYVERIDFDRDAVFGVHDDSLRARRRRPSGASRRSRGARAVGARRASRPRRRQRAVRARRGSRAQPLRADALHALPAGERRRSSTSRSRFGMHIVAEAGEADAHSSCRPRPPGSIAGEFVTDRLALYDYALKSHVATWKGVQQRRWPARAVPDAVRDAALLGPRGVTRGQDAANVTPDRYLAHLRGTLERIRADGFYKSERVIRTPQTPAHRARRRRRGRQLLRQQLPRPGRRPAARRRRARRSRPVRLRHGVRALHLRHAERAPGARSRARRVPRHRRRDPLLELLRRERRAVRDAARPKRMP